MKNKDEKIYIDINYFWKANIYLGYKNIVIIIKWDIYYFISQDNNSICSSYFRQILNL